jgi:hypothetical protein
LKSNKTVFGPEKSLACGQDFLLLPAEARAVAKVTLNAHRNGFL